jgi:hypothetical protein
VATGAPTTIDPSAASIVRGLLPFFVIDSLGIGASIFVFKKRPAPSVGEIKVRHVEQQHRVVPLNSSSKPLAQRVPEIALVLFGFHCL